MCATRRRSVGGCGSQFEGLTDLQRGMVCGHSHRRRCVSHLDVQPQNGVNFRIGVPVDVLAIAHVKHQVMVGVALVVEVRVLGHLNLPGGVHLEIGVSAPVDSEGVCGIIGIPDHNRVAHQGAGCGVPRARSAQS